MRPKKGKLEEKRRRETDFCLNRCPHAKDSDCRWTPKVCMAEERRRVRART